MKNDTDMMNPSTKVSRTLARSGIFDQGKEVVVACGYAVGGAFGYFICWEAVDENGTIHYSEPISFIQKENEYSYRDLLAKFKQYVSSHKNK